MVYKANEVSLKKVTYKKNLIQYKRLHYHVNKPLLSPPKRL